MAAIAVILAPVIIGSQIRSRLVYHHFVSIVKIEVAVHGRQVRRIPPIETIEINKLVIQHVVINVDIGQVIKLSVIIAVRSPLRLGANIDIYANTHLRICFLQKQTRSKYQGKK